MAVVPGGELGPAAASSKAGCAGPGPRSGGFPGLSRRGGVRVGTSESSAAARDRWRGRETRRKLHVLVDMACALLVDMACALLVDMACVLPVANNGTLAVPRERDSAARRCALQQYTPPLPPS